MAFVSEISSSTGIPPQYRAQASICCECGNKISNGGMWAMNQLHLGICSSCAPILLDWYIDTLLDTNVIDEENDMDNIQKLSNDIIDRYKRKKFKKIQYGKKHM